MPEGRHVKEEESFPNGADTFLDGPVHGPLHVLYSSSEMRRSSCASKVICVLGVAEPEKRAAVCVRVTSLTSVTGFMIHGVRDS